jgi:uncharacterized protein (TIGR03067 family)
MRRLFPLLAVLFVVLLFGFDSPKEYDDKTEYAVGIEGAWRWTEIEDAGGRRKLDDGTVYTFHNGVVTIDRGSGNQWRAPYRIDHSSNPPHLDFILNGGRTYKFIYRIDGDTLRIASNGYDWSRPKGFDDKYVGVQIFKRVK